MGKQVYDVVKGMCAGDGKLSYIKKLGLSKFKTWYELQGTTVGMEGNTMVVKGLKDGREEQLDVDLTEYTASDIKEEDGVLYLGEIWEFSGETKSSAPIKYK